MRIEIKERILTDNIESISYIADGKLYIFLNKKLVGEKKFAIVMTDIVKYLYPGANKLRIKDENITCRMDRKTVKKNYFKERFVFRVKNLDKYTDN